MLKVLLLISLLDVETGDTTPSGVVPIFQNFAACEEARDLALNTKVPPNTILRARCVQIIIGSP